jgi:gamma-glutamyltranspeptidase/glutathione hydrolase
MLRCLPARCALLLLSIGIHGGQGDGQPPPATETNQAEPERVRLTTDGWAEGEKERYLQLNRRWGTPKPLASGKKGMVVGTSSAFAVRAGVEALRKGGSAMDAALTTAAAQVVLDGGSWNSFAGILTLVAYEKETRQILSLDAGFVVPEGETHPSDIPRAPTPSGRTALVPGFVRGMEVAHQRMGRLPFAALFDPAIELARDGFPMGPVLGGLVQARLQVLNRYMPTRSIFFAESGRPHAVGDLFVQKELAETLEALAAGGSTYFYEGDWARKFVEETGRFGGKISKKDMRSYEAIWTAPYVGEYRGLTVATPGEPSLGGLHLVEALHLLEYASPQRQGRPWESAAALNDLMQIARIGPLLSVSPEPWMRYHLPGVSPAPLSRATRESAESIWKKMSAPGWMRRFQNVPEEPPTPKDSPEIEDPNDQRPHREGGGHTDAIVAVDAAGNVVVLNHSIATTAWGSTGIFVGGVSIPDAGAYFQRRLEAVGPGGRVPNELNPSILLRPDGLALASGAIGAGLHEAALQAIHAVVDHGLDAKAAAEAPSFFGMTSGVSKEGTPRLAEQVVPEGRFPPEILEAVRAMGQPILELAEKEARAYRGYWIGIVIEPETGILRGGLGLELNGYALAE